MVLTRGIATRWCAGSGEAVTTLVPVEERIPRAAAQRQGALDGHLVHAKE
jgi:hypothetical protein